MSLGVLPLFEMIRANTGAHDRSLFVEDARVDYEHKYLDVERFVFIQDTARTLNGSG